ncbi:MAG: PepSY domain-containing protein [Jannaschia sp.]
MRNLALLSLLALASPALAADLTAETNLGTTIEAVQASLTEMGYDIRKAEMEDGKIEVYFVGNGQMGEVYVDTADGHITKLDLK